MTFILRASTCIPARPLGAALRARSPLVVASRGACTTNTCIYTRSRGLATSAVPQNAACLGISPRRAVSSTSFTNNDLPAKGQQETGLAQQTSSDGVVATHPIDFDVASKIEGNESQIVTVALEPGQVLRAESGSMMFMTDGITMETTTGGGMSAGFKRMLTGQNVFISDFRYEGEPATTGLIALGTDFPSKIVRLNIKQYGGKIVAQKGALLCASHTVDIEMEVTKKLTTGLFGGEGFVLQGLTGEGEVFLKAGGTLVRKDLQEGEELRVASGALVAFSQGVDFDIQTMPGFKNVLFGGEGLFVTTLAGPGTVFLQGQPPERMISEIARRVPSGGIGLAVPIGGGGMGGGGGDGGKGSEGEGEGEGTP